MRQLINKVENYCVRQQLLTQGGHILVALSGGADSVCLLHLLKQLQPKWKLQLAAAHLHHGLARRGRGRGCGVCAGIVPNMENTVL